MTRPLGGAANCSPPKTSRLHRCVCSSNSQREKSRAQCVVVSLRRLAEPKEFAGCLGARLLTGWAELGGEIRVEVGRRVLLPAIDHASPRLLCEDSRSA
eukprot:6308022-Pyramimonas_sp.AAC.1